METKHSSDQLVAYCFCPQFGAEQVVNSGSLELHCWKQLPAAAENIRAMRVNRLHNHVFTLTIDIKIWYKTINYTTLHSKK